MTAALAEQRNSFVAALADRIFMSHAASGSRTLELFRDLIAQGKTVHPIVDPTNVDTLQWFASHFAAKRAAMRALKTGWAQGIS